MSAKGSLFMQDRIPRGTAARGGDVVCIECTRLYAASSSRSRAQADAVRDTSRRSRASRSAQAVQTAIHASNAQVSAGNQGIVRRL